jgi:hypothetical protein
MRLPNRTKRVVLAVVGVMLIVIALLTPIPLTHTPAPVRPPLVRVPLQERYGHYYLKVRIQGNDGWMLLDTGAAATVVFEPALESLTYTPLQARESAYFAFLDRRIDARRAEVPDVSVGEWRILRLNALLVADTFICQAINYQPINGLPVFGILGYDYLRQWRVVSIERASLALHRGSVTPPPSARMFRLVEIGGHPAVGTQINQTRGWVWVIDTGSVENLVSASKASAWGLAVRTYRGEGRTITPLAFVALRDAGGQTIHFPAAVVPQGQPPFAKKDTYGLLGNALLKRYQIVIDHELRRVWFTPTDTAQATGTYGLLLFAEPGRPSLHAHFVIPQEASASDDFVRITAVDGVAVNGWDEKIVRRLIAPRVGSSVRLEVQARGGQKRQLVCTAFAPDEVGVQQFHARTQVGSRVFHHTVVALKREQTWLYPIDVWGYLTAPLHSQNSSQTELRNYAPKLTLSDGSEAGSSGERVIVSQEVKLVLEDPPDRRGFKMSIEPIE